MANIIGDRNFTAKLNQVLGTPTAGILEFFSAFNMFLSITAFLGNALVFVALLKSRLFILQRNFSYDVWRSVILLRAFLAQPLYATVITGVFSNIYGFASF